MATIQNTTKSPREVQAMFDRIAQRYRLMNRVITMGMDQRWRRFVVSKIPAKSQPAILDLATGTGEIAFEILRAFPNADVIASDFSLGMLEQGKQRSDGHKLNWVAADAMCLPFPKNSFDAVTFGYLLRNVADVGVALREIHRVLKPGGRVICLDTTPPPPSPLRPLINAYLRFAMPLIGRLMSPDGSAYSYLSGSTLSFANPETLAATFSEHGFSQVRYRTFMLKTIAVHWADA